MNQLLTGHTLEQETFFQFEGGISLKDVLPEELAQVAFGGRFYVLLLQVCIYEIGIRERLNAFLRVCLDMSDMSV